MQGMCVLDSGHKHRKMSIIIDKYYNRKNNNAQAKGL
jgi:hypothetical protein